MVMENPNKKGNSFIKIFFLGLILILSGILIGVLAAKFLPISPKDNSTVDDSSSVIEQTSESLSSEITAEVTLIDTPKPILTATPSALLSLKWNLLTVKSPVSFFNSYRLYYPNTWSIKQYKNTPSVTDDGSSVLNLAKGTTSLNITQGAGDAGICLYPSDSDRDGMTTRFGSYKEISGPNSPTWRLAELSNSQGMEFGVCEKKDNGGFVSSTVIGRIKLTGDNITPAILDEVNYMLEKLAIIK